MQDQVSKRYLEEEEASSGTPVDSESENRVHEKKTHVVEGSCRLR